MGPPPSLPPYQREPADEYVPIQGQRVPKLVTLKAKTERDRKIEEFRGVPNAARAQKGLSIKALLRKQPAYIRNSARDVVIRKLKQTKTKGGKPAITGVCRDMATKPMRLHKFQVIGLSTEIPTLVAQRRVKVSCDCEAFMYYSEYALWTWGAANIRYSNGKPATVTNRANFPLLCKHLEQVLETLAERNL